MKRFIVKLILVITPILLFVISVNYFGDAANLFSSDYENRIASGILKGHNVTNVDNYNERLLQRLLITNTDLCPKVLILGSSRVMLLNSSLLKEASVFNNGVSGASVEDLIAIIQMYDQKKCIPKKIIIGLDPWTLNPNNTQSRWKSLDTEYYSFLQKIGIYEPENSTLKKLKYAISKKIYYYQLFSPSYFKGSLTSLLNFETNKPRVTDKTLNEGFTKVSDGSIVYDLKFRTASTEEKGKIISAFTSNGIYSIENFHDLSINIEQKLDSLVHFIKSKNSTIEFLLIPYHPKVYEIIDNKEKYKQVKASEVFFNSLAVKYGAKVIGSFNPTTLKMTDLDFYDGMHLNEVGLKKLF